MTKHDLNPLLRHPILRDAIRSSTDIPPILFACLAVVSLLPFVAAAADGSFLLKGSGVGLFEHYGNMSFALVLPLTFLFAYRGILSFSEFACSFESCIVRDKFEKDGSLEVFLDRYLRKDILRWLFWLFAVVGCGYAFCNAWNTTHPTDVWGHDVYDSIYHPWGYVAQRIFFFVWWGYLLPVLCYRLVTIVVILHGLFTRVIRTDSLNPQPMHPDGAGGLGKLGEMALYGNFAMLSTMAFTVMLYFTHGFNVPLVAGGVAQFLMLPVVFFGPLIRPHHAMKKNKYGLLASLSAQYGALNSRLYTLLKADARAFAGTLDESHKAQEEVRALYQDLKQLPTWPFDVPTVSQFMASIGFPVLLILVQRIFSN